MKIFDLAFQGLDQSGIDYLDTIRQDTETQVVHKNEDAASVVRKIAPNKSYVIVQDDDNKIVGVVTEDLVNTQLAALLQQGAGSLPEGLAKLVQSYSLPLPGLPTRVRPQLFYCAKGRHFTSELPCPEHR